MATVLFLIAAAACFGLEVVLGVLGRPSRVPLAALGLLFLTIPLIVTNWPSEPFVVH